MKVEIVVKRKTWFRELKQDEVKVIITGVRTTDDINQAKDALEKMKYNEKIFDAFKNRKK